MAYLQEEVINGQIVTSNGHLIGREGKEPVSLIYYCLIVCHFRRLTDPCQSNGSEDIYKNGQRLLHALLYICLDKTGYSTFWNVNTQQTQCILNPYNAEIV